MNDKDYFYCLKRNETCEKDLFGNIACENCTTNGECKHCGRKGTSLCSKCKNSERTVKDEQ